MERVIHLVIVFREWSLSGQIHKRIANRKREKGEREKKSQTATLSHGAANESVAVKTY